MSVFSLNQLSIGQHAIAWRGSATGCRKNTKKSDSDIWLWPTLLNMWLPHFL